VASFSEQMKVHAASRQATSALEAVSRAAIVQAIVEWDDGVLDARSVRWRLEAIVRDAYRSSASVARSVSQQSSGLDTWRSGEVFNTEYLQSLLADVRRNLRDYKSGILTREGAVLRLQHSAGVAAQRGYTDQILSSYTELEDFGLVVRKYWVANFVNNDPCPACRRLHGTAKDLHEDFKAESGEPGVYIDLAGPPRHPRCQCRLYIFTVTLENAFETPDFEQPQDAPSMMSTADVQRLPEKIFKAVVASFRAISKFLRSKG